MSLRRQFLFLLLLCALLLPDQGEVFARKSSTHGARTHVSKRTTVAKKSSGKVKSSPSRHRSARKVRTARSGSKPRSAAKAERRRLAAARVTPVTKKKAKEKTARPQPPASWYCIEGTVTTTLSRAFAKQGASGPIAREFLRALNGEMDVPADVRKGDAFRVLLSRRGKKGPAMLAAVEYNGSVTGRIRAYHFVSTEHGISGWFTSEEMKNKRIVPSPYWVLRISSPYGMRRHPVSGRRRMHEGTDFAAAIGTPVLAVEAGRVSTAGVRGGYGKLVEVNHGTSRSRYGHLSVIHVKPGQRVERGALIGKVGSTGISTGPHLHFEYLRKGRHMDPDRLEISPLGEFSQDLQIAYKTEVRRLNQLWTTATRLSTEKKALAAGRK